MVMQYLLLAEIGSIHHLAAAHQLHVRTRLGAVLRAPGGVESRSPASAAQLR